ncbi:DUF7342 family protein [Haloglomus litoreum]|uniref:DUF7342 family protein n=1 Tax=Haloglomus litoreum TaxID=3034026 RepID=UPI0023E8EAC1|nr:hypothetical protein [Haloglomus sp. DT116]
MVDSWTDSTTARERVETIATTLSEPRTVNWVAEQAEVEWDTAKRHLASLADAGLLTVTDDGQYVPDPTRAYFDHLRDLILENERSELRAELEAIAERADDWKQRYGVGSPEELEATLADDLPGDEVSERRRILRRWEQSQRSRDLIRKALALYDDVQSLGDGTAERSGSTVEEAG